MAVWERSHHCCVVSRNKRTRFECEVWDIVDRQGYAMYDDLYRVYYGRYGKKNWGSELLTTLSQWATGNGRMKKVEISIPGEAVSVFPGRHAMNMAVFFVNERLDEGVAVSRCSDALKRKIDDARRVRDEKKNAKTKDAEAPRRRRLKPADIERAGIGGMKRVTSQALLSDSPGYVSSKILRLSLLHHFLFVTFDSEFSARDAVNEMPMELYMKIIGVAAVPPVLELEPKLRFLLVRCLPKSLHFEIGLEDGVELVSKYLSKMVLASGKKNQFELGLLIQVGADRFQVIRGQKVLELFNGFKIRLSMDSVDDLAYFWRYLEMVDLFENFDGFARTLWIKRWCIDKAAPKSRGGAVDFLDQILQDVTPSSNAYFWQDLSERVGYERPTLQSRLAFASTSEEMRESARALKRKPSNFPVFANCLEAKGETDKEIIEFVARYRTSEMGIIHAKPIDWSRCGGRPTKQRFANMIRCDPASVSLLDALMAENLARKFPRGDIELRQSQLLNLFHCLTRGMMLPADLGEVVETTKASLLGSAAHTTVMNVMHLLENVRWDENRIDALLFLSFIGFLSEQERDGVFKTNKRGKQQLTMDEMFYLDYQKAKHLASTAWFSITRKPIVEFSPGGVAFLLKTSCVELTLTGSGFVDPILQRIPEPMLSVTALHESIVPDTAPDVEETSEQEVLFQHFADMSLIAIQIETCIDFRLAGMFYGFIMHGGRSGLQLDRVIRRFCPSTTHIDALFDTLEFLINFGFVRQKRSSTSMPTFVADIYSDGISQSHYWTTIRGEVDLSTLTRVQCEVYDIIQDHPGIELLELFKYVPYLCITDLLSILEVWELDEAVFVTSVKHTTDFDSDFGDKTIIAQIPSRLRICYDVARSIVDPTFDRPLLRIYPTRVGGTSLPNLFVNMI